MISTAVVLAETPEWLHRVGGLTVVERAVRALHKAGVGRVTVVGSEDVRREAGGFPSPGSEPTIRWIRRSDLPTRGSDVDRSARNGGPTLVLTAPIVIDDTAVASLHELAVTRSVLVSGGVNGCDGSTGALLIRDEEASALSELIEEVASPPAHAGGPSAIREWPIVSVGGGVWCPLTGSGGAKAAEHVLLRSLTRQATDGFMAVWVDRRLSQAVSRQLAKTSVTPNQISLATLVPALAGALLIAHPRPLWSGIGALLFWVSTVLDGCDGEVARLKYLASETGAQLDLLCDNISLIALFLGIAMHVHHESPGAGTIYPTLAIVGGLLTAMTLEYSQILSPRIRGEGTPAGSNRQHLYERLASRDFAYVLPFFAFGGVLRWFFWGTAVGVNLFWLALAALIVSERRRAP